MKLKTVGIKDICYPVRVRNKGGGFQETVATISLQADLPKEQRENCVSVFIGVLNKHQENISVEIFQSLLEEIKTSLKAESARIEMNFPLFIEKIAPVSGTKSLMEYSCSFTGNIGANNDLILSVTVPVTTLCPCSKEISDGGAHNQRAEVNLNVKFSGFIWLEDLISLVESASSSEVFALLKRPDEKFVTEQAFHNPMFVEDVVRIVAEKALSHPDIIWFSASVESFESIHNHSAYAYLDSDELIPSRPS